MSELVFRKAERSKAKLRLGVCGPSGSGKTTAALLITKGLGGKTAFVDTEAGSGDLYASLFDYDILTLAAPFTPEKYIEAVRAAEEAGYDNIIIDSLSHAWAGDGGLLDQQGKWADKEKNSYTAWRHVTPSHNRLIDAMLQSRCHVIATMRSKVDYVLVTNERGKQEPKKVGLAPVQREGMDYEFTVVLDIDVDHDAKASKDRTRLFADPLPFKVTEKTGSLLLDWLNSGKEVAAPCIRCRQKKGVIVESDPTSKGLTTYDLCAECVEAWKLVNPAAPAA